VRDSVLASFLFAVIFLFSRKWRILLGTKN